MNLTLLGGVEVLRKYFNKERLIAYSLLNKVIGMSIILAVFPIGTVQINAKEVKPVNQVWNSELRLDVQNAIPVVLKTIDSPKIILGESNNQKELREAQEKTQAETQAQTQIQFQSREVVSREIPRDYPVDASFADKRALAKRAAAAYGVDWRLVEAVWYVESGRSWDTQVTSYAGAQGPMQFMPGTWRSVGVDANSDGIADVNNAEDAVYSGAKYLAMGGAASGDIDSALYSYNHAGWYVEKVKDVMYSIQE